MRATWTQATLAGMLALAAAVALSTPAFDVSEKGFWFKSYSIPSAFCVKRLAAEFDDIKDAHPVLEACGPSVPPGDGPFERSCRLTREKTDAFVEGVKRRGHLFEFSQDCREPERYPELDFKHEALTREARSLALSSAAFPGITGLLEVQLGMLEYLRARRDEADSVLLGLAVRRSSDAPPLRAPSVGGSSLVSLPQAVQWHPWARKLYDPCQQVDYVYSEYDAPPGSDVERKVRAAASSLGEPYTDPNCELTRSFAPIAVVLSTKPLKEIRDKMTALPGLRKWSKSHRRQFDQAIPDDRKVEILARELAAGEATFKAAPVLTSFVRGELDRLSAKAPTLAELRKGTLVYFRRAEPAR